MRFHETAIDIVRVVEFQPVGDERGTFERVYCDAEFERAGIAMTIVQANLSRNRDAFTLRGLHFQDAPYEEAKLVRCQRGRLFDVAVDARPDSPTYLQWFGIELSANGREALYLGPGTAHGYMTLEADSELNYSVSARYTPSHERGFRWNDPKICIAWPAEPQLISDRDRNHPLL